MKSFSEILDLDDKTILYPSDLESTTEPNREESIEESNIDNVELILVPRHE